MNAPLTKDQAEQHARSLGWKGDPARTSKQEFLDFIDLNSDGLFAPTVKQPNAQDPAAMMAAAIAGLSGSGSGAGFCRMYSRGICSASSITTA